MPVPARHAGPPSGVDGVWRITVEPGIADPVLAL